MKDQKNLGVEFEEITDEAKALVAAEFVASDMMSGMDIADVVKNVRAMKLLNQALDLCVEVMKKQDALMDKMDKALDKYLKD